VTTLLEQARAVARQARALGADEVNVGVSRSTEVSLMRRAGKVEQASQATSQAVSIALLVDDRFGVHSTSDLRPAAVEAFLRNAIAATRVLEPETERRLAPGEQCGRGSSDEALDAFDPGWEALTAEARRTAAESLEAHVDALPGRDKVLSATIHVGDSTSEGARVMSNGFEGTSRSTGFGVGAEMTLQDTDGRRPEGYAFYSALHQADLPGIERIAQETWASAAERLGSGPIASGRYPMLLDRKVAGRILGVLGGPLSGSELHQGRSFLAGKQGTRIAASGLTLLDDPTIRRGLGSRSWDGDAFPARPMVVLREGVLENYYVNLYYSRKLGVAPTTGSRSNWVVPAGAVSPTELVSGLPTCILVTGFLGGNSNGLTGDFSFGVQGVLLERGVPVKSLSEMNVSGNIGDVLQRFVASANDVWTYGGLRTGSLLFDDVSFSGS
jgi:PmbA protein